MTTLNNWGQVAVIVAGYALGLYFQNRQIDMLNKRIDDLYHYLDVRFGEIERRLSALEDKLGVKQ